MAALSWSGGQIDCMHLLAEILQGCLGWAQHKQLMISWYSSQMSACIEHELVHE